MQVTNSRALVQVVDHHYDLTKQLGGDLLLYLVVGADGGNECPGGQVSRIEQCLARWSRGDDDLTRASCLADVSRNLGYDAEAGASFTGEPFSGRAAQVE